MDDRINGYAKGFLELARAEGSLESVESELFSIAETLESSPELRSALTDPQLPNDKKTAIVDDLLGGKASSLTVGLVHLLVDQDRASELPSIARALVEIAAASRDRAVAEIRSAVPLDDQTIERLAAALGKATGKKLEVKAVVDESVVGGIVARVGDTVIDGSVAGRFQSLRNAVQSR
ncbi:MAG: ATP synthase F1 subunit delta [Actinobacteria bacterium]|nr:MAG: ATP synthase F1 subunit delta [Actinomycetota bacterium]REK35972.1 MAG: ATP synthase F1 subunit delta [Actinomycetota bacterium]